MCFIFIFTGRVQTPPTEAGPVYLQNMILESVLRPRAHLISVFCFWIERLHKGTVYHFRNNRTYFDDRLSQMWVHTPIVYSQNACFAQNITLAPRSTSTEGSCERFMSTPPAPDYADAEPSLLPFRQRLSRLFPACHPVQIPQAGLFQDTTNSSAEDLILRPKNQFFGRSRFQLCGTIKTSLHVPFL